MASKYEINIDRNRSGRAYLNMLDLDMDTATDWVVIDPPFDQAPAEVAFACAYLKSAELREMTVEAIAVAYAVYVIEAHEGQAYDFDIHTVGQEWALELVSSWKKQGLEEVAGMGRDDEDARRPKPKL